MDIVQNQGWICSNEFSCSKRVGGVALLRALRVKSVFIKTMFFEVKLAGFVHEYSRAKWEG